MKRPYRLFASGRRDWHMSFVASYGTAKTAEAAAIKKLTNRDTMSPTTDVMVVYADTGEVVFRGKC